MNEFKLGDSLECVKVQGNRFLMKGNIYTVKELVGEHFVRLVEIAGNTHSCYNSSFRLATPKTQQFTNHTKYLSAMQATLRSYAQAVADGMLRVFEWWKCDLCLITHPEANPKSMGLGNGGFSRSCEGCAECPHMTINKKLCTRLDRHKYAARILEIQDWIEQYKADAELPCEAPVAEEKVWEPLKVELNIDSLGAAAFWMTLLNPCTETLLAFAREHGQLEKAEIHNHWKVADEIVRAEGFSASGAQKHFLWEQINEAFKAHFGDSE